MTDSQNDSDDDSGKDSESSSSSEDDDNEANAAGGGGGSSDSSDDGDGLTDNAVFAIAFGVSVAVVTCCLSGLLALAGSGGSDANRVGPKS